MQTEREREKECVWERDYTITALIQRFAVRSENTATAINYQNITRKLASCLFWDRKRRLEKEEGIMCSYLRGVFLTSTAPSSPSASLHKSFVFFFWVLEKWEVGFGFSFFLSPIITPRKEYKDFCSLVFCNYLGYYYC